ncbi:MAG: flagellar biosynthesis protein FlgL [Sphingomonadales bacterium 32-68-7]|nr:MAG: flagellar biosynthesis protein FlgL [Sphingomonadales bacterium 12-68-11]OYX10145.1 MAG: flagellar biosynthesis protein FlgL [Sphingomonadales bacterium 32-68-7]
MTLVSTSAFYERVGLDMTTLRKRAETLQGQISSGERVNRSSDDPVAAARLRELARSEAISEVNVANANRALSDLTLADSALQEIAENVIRAQELATQASSDTLSPAQRASIGEQIANIRENLIALANSRDSAGHALFGGEGVGAAYTVSAGVPGYAGTASSGELALGDGQSVTRGVTGPEVFEFTYGGAPTDLFAVLGTLADALKGGSADPAAAARGSLNALSAGLETITTTETVVGARMNWVDLNISRHERQQEMRTTEQTEVGKVDPAKAITELQEIMTVLEASQASFVQLSNLSLFDMMR